MLKLYLLFLSLAIGGLAGCNRQQASPTPSEETRMAAGAVGSSLPDFSVTDLQGHPLSSADLRGRVVLVDFWATWRSEEHTSELQSRGHLVCRLLLEKKKNK